jgi:hypothetical protein
MCRPGGWDEECGVAVIDEAALKSLIAALDAAISKCIDAYNIASEAGDDELADMARRRIEDLRELRQTVLTRPTRRTRWLFARSPRGDARAR